VKLTHLTASAIAIAACAALPFAPSAQAQIVATQRAGQGLPPGQSFAPDTPGGMVLIGSDIWYGDQVWGLRHLTPADTTNPDPVNSGALIFDLDQSHSIGGNGLCLPFCSVGQLAFDGVNVYAAIYDHQKGGPATTFPGVWRLTPSLPVVPNSSVWNQSTLLAQNAGLGGNQPSTVALGPDGNLYVGFLKNGNIVRITNINPSVFSTNQTQVVQSVGVSPNGRPVRSLVFVGPDLYIGTTDNLARISNAISPSCTGGCNAVALVDGFGGNDHVGLATDGINRIYMSINGRGVMRYSIQSGTTSVVSTTGFNPTLQAPVPYGFVGGHANLLLLDGSATCGSATTRRTACAPTRAASGTSRPRSWRRFRLCRRHRTDRGARGRRGRRGPAFFFIPAGRRKPIACVRRHQPSACGRAHERAHFPPTTATPWISISSPGRARPLTEMSALAGKHSLKVSLRIWVSRSPSRGSVMNTVMVVMSLSPLPPTALMVLSSSPKISRTWSSKLDVAEPVCPPSQTTLPPSVTTARENARSCARASGA
jgi:hypothetical protein